MRSSSDDRCHSKTRREDQCRYSAGHYHLPGALAFRIDRRTLRVTCSMILRHFYGIIVRGETVSALRASHSEEQRPTVFLAHSHGDKAYVREIYRLLKLDGFHPWLDEMNLVAGQNWELEVEKAVQTADA